MLAAHALLDNYYFPIPFLRSSGNSLSLITQHTHTFVLFFHFSRHLHNYNPVNRQATTPTSIESTISQEPMSLNSVLGMMMPQRSVSALGQVIFFPCFPSLYL